MGFDEMNANAAAELKLEDKVEERLLHALRHHFSGWRRKIEKDFSESSFAKELSKLGSDPVYAMWALDSPQYVLVRLVGRMSISFGRRLGEIYEKIPRFVAAARFGLTPKDVAPVIDGLELDIGMLKSKLSERDREHLEDVVRSHFKNHELVKGLGVEIRYNFNPNDSARLRKDVVMARLLKRDKYFPVYLIFSSISPREEAISRLKRAGWSFLIGNNARTFMRELLGIDIAEILERPRIRLEIRKEMESLMESLVSSYAFVTAVRNVRMRS